VRAQGGVVAIGNGVLPRARPPEILRLLERSLALKLFPLLKADLHHASQLNETWELLLLEPRATWRAVWFGCQVATMTWTRRIFTMRLSANSVA
jgi:hypothetical protein